MKVVEHTYSNEKPFERYTVDEAGKKQGLYESWHENGEKRVRCTYKDDDWEGLYEDWHTNGEKRGKCTYRDGKWEGLCENWYENGEKRTKYTVANGKMEGLYELWYENGEKRTKCTYRDDKLEGLFEEWDEEGNLVKQCVYADGKEVVVTLDPGKEPCLPDNSNECALCIACETESRQVLVNVACGHLSLCRNCALRVDSCPFCRAKKTGLVPVFIS